MQYAILIYENDADLPHARAMNVKPRTGWLDGLLPSTDRCGRGARRYPAPGSPTVRLNGRGRQVQDHMPTRRNSLGAST